MLIALHAQRVRQARDRMKTGHSASAVWVRRFRRLGSAKTAWRQISWTVLIRAAARVHLARSRTSIEQPAWRVQALRTPALGKTVLLASLRVLSMPIAPHAQRVRQAQVHIPILQTALTAVMVGIQHLVYVQSVWPHAL